MKYLLTVALCIVLLAGICAAADKPAIESQKEKESYSIGYQVGQNMKMDGVDVDSDALIKGLLDAIGGKEPRLANEEMRKLIVDLKKRSREAQMRKLQEQSAKNLTDGLKFLEENAGKEGVKVTESGLQYKVIREGDGSLPKAEDRVTVHYRGTLLNGKEFDSSYARNKPETFDVDGIIKGWTEALQLMKVGSKWQLFIPPDLAYGKGGMGEKIPSNSVLIFDVELLGIEKEAEKKPQ